MGCVGGWSLYKVLKWMYDSSSIFCNGCWLVVLKLSMLIFGCHKDHLGVYWRGCIGGLFMCYIDELGCPWIGRSKWIMDYLINVSKFWGYGSFTMYIQSWLVRFFVNLIHEDFTKIAWKVCFNYNVLFKDVFAYCHT